MSIRESDELHDEIDRLVADNERLTRERDESKPSLKWHRDKDGFSYSRARGDHYSLLVRAAQRYGEEEERGLRGEWFWAMDAYQKGFAPSEEAAKAAAERAAAMPSDEIDRLAGEVERLTRENDSLVESLRDPAAVRANILRGAISIPPDLVWLHDTDGPVAARVADLTRERDEVLERMEAVLRAGPSTALSETILRRAIKAEARAEALATLAKRAVSSIEALHDLCDRLMGDSDLDGDPDAKVMARALKVTERLKAALTTATPPADLTQHPAYRAGVEAGTEQERKRIEAKVRELARMVPDGVDEMVTTSDDDDPNGWWGAEDVLDAIRNHDTKEVRDA